MHVRLLLLLVNDFDVQGAAYSRPVLSYGSTRVSIQDEDNISLADMPMSRGTNL